MRRMAARMRARWRVAIVMCVIKSSPVLRGNGKKAKMKYMINGRKRPDTPPTPSVDLPLA
jgi:hypothetical protein